VKFAWIVLDNRPNNAIIGFGGTVIDFSIGLKRQELIAGRAEFVRRLQNNVALVTGAGRGIGRSIAIQFAHEGAWVVTADVNGESAEKVAAEIVASGGRALGRAVDVGNQAQVEALIDSIIDEWGRIDLLANVAGVGLTKLFLNTSLEEWERVLRVNLTGCFLCSQAAARVMLVQGGGKIINIASLSGQRGGAGPRRVWRLEGRHHAAYQGAGGRVGALWHYGQ
jgi:NAD(P)-dependent dehydrogenase (short-subunit alcohol dehydrogenase family)